MRYVAVALCVLMVAGCGGTAERAKPKQPRLPHDLAASWARQSDLVASELGAGNGCAAQQAAASLQTQFISAVNAHRVPPRLQEQLGSALNDLHARIVCTPPPATAPKHGPKPHPKHPHPHPPRKHKGPK